jgi:hypothetical protein
MKKNDLLILGSTFLYSWLFYHQQTGINFMLFSAVLCLFLFFLFKTQALQTKWLLAATGTLLSGLGVYLFGNGLSVLANISSLALLSAFTFDPRTSVITAWFYSLYTLLTSGVYMLLEAVRYNKKPIDDGNSPKNRRVGLFAFIIPAFLVGLFFIFYSEGSLLFGEFIRKLNLDFISFPWIWFTIGGYCLMYSFFSFRAIPGFIAHEALLPNRIEKKTYVPERSGGLFPVSQEHLSGIIAFVFLNLLTLLVNLLDTKFLFVDGKLPEGISYSRFVHQGVGSLIVSIILAIALILFYFRGELNFYKKKKRASTIALLALFWIGQNVYMLYTSCLKNAMYIHEYSLTYKRIGVDAWLLLALFGLITTAYKVYYIRTNMFLVRINSWLCYSALIIAALFNWNKFIAEYNLKESKNVDYAYLLTLSSESLLPVLEACQHPDVSSKACQLPASEEGEYSRDFENYSVSELLRNQLAVFLYEQGSVQWKGSCLSKSLLAKKLRGYKKGINYSHLASY